MTADGRRGTFCHGIDSAAWSEHFGGNRVRVGVMKFIIEIVVRIIR